MYVGSSDYRGIKTVRVPAGRTSQSFSIPIINDGIVECTERFNIRIPAVSVCGVKISSSSNIPVEIKDNDSE